MDKRYRISYCSAPTGYGWIEDTDSIAEVRDIARSEAYGCNISAAVSVWDRVKNEIIFSKRAFYYKAEINLID